MKCERPRAASALCWSLIVAVLGCVVLASPSQADGPALMSPRTGSPASIPALRDVFSNQPVDLNGSRISSELITTYGLESEVACDFTSATDTRVTKIAWWGGSFNSDTQDPPPTVFNIYFYDDSSCEPGALLEEFPEVEPTVTAAGTDGEGFPTYKYETYVNLAITGGETYWVVVQADDHSYPPQWGWHQAGSVQGCTSMVRSDYFGYQTWTAASTPAGEPWDGSIEVHDNTAALEGCCFDDGFCEMLLAADCATAGGTAQGVAIDCTPNTCTQPTSEACCYPDNTCVEVPPEQCTAVFGVPQGPGTDCDPNPCNLEQVACCFADGSCFPLSAEACTGIGADPQGPGSVCEPNPCSPAEACCLQDGTCFDVQPATCVTFGGTPDGPGSDCDPNPCPQPPAQACCFEDGHCEMQTPADCTTADGSPQGTGTDCTPNDCTQPAPEACCFEDGSCQMQMQEACFTAGGMSWGFGTTCAPDNPCAIIVPTKDTSWGKLKSMYR
jgi:hypothetical protein